MGIIKVELPSIECDCGSNFHQSCVVRVGICPICSGEIRIPQSAVRIIERSADPVRPMPLEREDRLFLLEDRLLMGEIDRETYERLKLDITQISPEPRYCGVCGTRLYPGEQCGCIEERDIRCPECGCKITEDSEFCRTCGVILSEDFSEKLFQCSDCGRIVISTERVCDCGAALMDPGDSVCPECGHPVPEDRDSCPNCGLLLFVELMECPVCGQEVGLEDFECGCGALFVDRIDKVQCPECGNSISIDDRYCRSCGVQFRENALSSHYRLNSA